MKPITKVPPFPMRPAAGHKGTFGTVTLLAGSPGMLGAAILAARGALRGGRHDRGRLGREPARVVEHPRTEAVVTNQPKLSDLGPGRRA